ncbi:MAG: GNAT family N-acetyltransferase [Symploca sp. SIO2B6]|nr:GNAT family N-acetyltransferase [Symploca sp. SIO2B6]
MTPIPIPHIPMTLVLGNATDIDGVFEIVQQTIAEMKTYGNNQWDHRYPLRQRFEQDVASQSLYVFKDGEKSRDIMGFIVVDDEEPDGYETISWRSDRPCLIIHRLAVSADHRQRGVASVLEAFACGLAQERGITYLKVDTHSTNQRMQGFLDRKGYRQVGEMMAMGKEKPFYCYDKLLSVFERG